MVRFSPSRYPAPRTPGWGTNRRRGGVAGAVLTGLAALGKFGALKTLLTLAISFGAYAIVFGSPALALGLVVMILVHEMGHVVEIRRQGLKASAPLFIPFFGAAIFPRQHAIAALRHDNIGIAGPLAGTC